MLNRVHIPGASALALWSYAVYLVHKPVFMALRPQLERLHVDAGAPAAVVAVMAAGVARGWAQYRCVETPFMRLRARWTAGARPARLVARSAEYAVCPPGG